MNTLLAITTVLALIAVFFVLGMIRHLRRGRVLKASGSFAAGLAFASLGGAGVLLLGSLYSYGRLVGEQTVASIQFTENAPGDYTARLMIAGEPDRLLPLLGELEV